MLIIGIDPGISGAICFFQNGEITDVIDMPSMAEGKKNKRQINADAPLRKLLEWCGSPNGGWGGGVSGRAIYIIYGRY